jgi:hypothetical protein
MDASAVGPLDRGKLLEPPRVRPSGEREETPEGRSKNENDKGSLMLRIKRKRGAEPITALRIETLLSEGLDPNEVEEHSRRMQEDATNNDKEETRVKRRLTDRGKHDFSFHCSSFVH